jgi:predicted nucleic acid-binding protein
LLQPGCTILHHGLTVVSRDTSEFIKARAQVFNPWVENPPHSEQ